MSNDARPIPACDPPAAWAAADRHQCLARKFVDADGALADVIDTAERAYGSRGRLARLSRGVRVRLQDVAKQLARRAAVELGPIDGPAA